MGIAHDMMSAAAASANAGIQGVDFPDYPTMAWAATAAARRVDKFSRFCHTRVMQRKTVGCRDRSFRAPVPAHLSGYRVIPAAALAAVVDVDQIVLVLFGPD